VGGWCGSWAAGGGSCRILPAPVGLAAARPPDSGGEAAAAGQRQVQQPGQTQQQQQPVCSLSQQFLQDWLDSLGSLNTFG
jgi:hypothetical protein